MKFSNSFNSEPITEADDTLGLSSAVQAPETSRGFLDSIRRVIGNRLLGATLVFATAAGCGGKVDESDTTSKESFPGTIEFTTKDPVQGLLNGTFESDGHKINFEVARREANPTEELGQNTPLYAIDGRICDENKFCFANQAGGHAFADPNWVPDDSEENTPDNEDATKNFKTAWDLNQKLAEYGIGDFDGLTEEYQALVNISNEPPEKWITSQSDSCETELNTESNQENPEKDVSALKVAATNTYKHHFEIHAELLYYQPNPILPGILPPLVSAWHSSTYTKVLASNGSTYSSYETCNHGACAKSIPKACERDFSSRPKTIPINTKCIADATAGTKHPKGYTGCCMTQYNVLPGTVSHVCNDDSRLQRDFMIANGPVGQTYCSDKITASAPPSCK
jgi:hypothetical protein